jgi:ABC-type Fe3+ transport system substrate-binding protein
MNRVYRFAVVFNLFAIGLLLGGHALALEMTPELRKVVEGARAEGKLKIESLPDVLGGPAGVKAATAWMKKEFGIDVDGAWGPNPVMATQVAKIFTESQANQKSSSDAFAGTAVQVAPMLEKGLFRTVAWDRLMPGRITAEMIEGDGRAIRVLTQIPGVLYNKQKLPQMADLKSMNDLLKPELKGKFTTTPYLAGFDVLASEEVWGYKKTADYVSRLAGQVSGLLLCGASERIASGEQLALALDCSGSEHNRERFRNVLGLQVIADNAQRRFTYETIPVNSANPNTAILYVLYFSTPEGQKFVWDSSGFNLDTYPDSGRHQEVEAMRAKGIKFIDVTLNWWSRQKGVAQSHAELIKIVQRK